MTDDTWTLTDPDSYQWVRRLPYENPAAFECAQVTGPLPDGTWLANVEEVDLFDESHDHLVSCARSAYGGLDELARACGSDARFGDDGYPYQILAELVFEESCLVPGATHTTRVASAHEACELIDHILGEHHRDLHIGGRPDGGWVRR